MRVFSTFTGIGGFEIGIQNAIGPVEIVGYSEIDKYACSVYEYHFKGVKNYGDITKIKAEELPDFDCLVGGFPCQAFSIAGRRAGFADTRGTLFFDLARILQAKQPRLCVFENVKGLISHDNGSTFRTIITTIDELGYDCQWQVLNSKNFGVPQNRERIIIVGHLRGTPRPKVFPITGADQKDTRIIGEDDAYAIDASYHKGVGPDLARARRSLVRVGTLRTHNSGKGFREMKSGIVPTIPARARNDGSGQAVVYVPEATKKGYAEAEVGDSINLAVPSSKTRRGRVGKGIASTIEPNQRQYTIQPPVQLTEARTEEAKQIRRESFKTGREYAPRRGKVLVPRKDNMANTVTANQGKEALLLTSIPQGSIRRLTPLECERLQGFPDHWTQYGVGGVKYRTPNVIKCAATR